MHFITVTAAFVVGVIIGVVIGLIVSILFFLPLLLTGKSEDEIARTLSSAWRTNPSDPFNLNDVNHLP